MNNIDEQRLKTDLVYRFNYLREFIGFTDQDIETILSARPVLAPCLNDLVNAVYEKLFEFDATKRHFLKRQFGDEGPTPSSIEDLRVDHEMIGFRKEHLAGYLTRLINGPYDASLITYLDFTGKMQTPAVGCVDLVVPLVQMNALMGFLADAINDTICGFAITEDAKANMVRAFNKLLWIQNDLINRHYCGDSVLKNAAKEVSQLRAPSALQAATHPAADPTRRGLAGANPGG